MDDGYSGLNGSAVRRSMDHKGSLLRHCGSWVKDLLVGVYEESHPIRSYELHAMRAAPLRNSFTTEVSARRPRAPPQATVPMEPDRGLDNYCRQVEALTPADFADKPIEADPFRPPLWSRHKF